MKSRTTTNLDLLVLLGSILLTDAMLLLAMIMREHLSIWTPLEPGANQIPFMLFPLVGVIWFVMQIIFSTPRLVRNGQLIEGLWRLVAAIGLASLTFAGALFLSFRQTPRLFFIYFVLLDLIALILFYGIMRLIVRHRSTHTQSQNRMVIAGAGQAGLRLAQAVMRQWNSATPVVGFLDNDPALVGAEVGGWPVLGRLDEAEQIIERYAIDDIIITLPLDAHPEAVKLVRRLQGTAVHIRLVPDFLDFAVMHA